MGNLRDRPDRERWGLILAGGQGLRLRELTRVIAGDERPKQFCSLLGGETLLEQTRRRLARAVSPARTLVVLTRSHERFYRSLLETMPPDCAVVQPEDRGTAAAILYGLLRIAKVAPLTSVVVFPSDHYVADDGIFMTHVSAALDAVRARPDLLVLLGIEPHTAETQYGWIEPADPIPDTPLFRVRRFMEKPSPAWAQRLLERGCLWNTFVMVGRVPAFCGLIRHTAPKLYAAFADASISLGTSSEAPTMRALYAQLAPISFSHRMLGARPRNLAVLPVKGVYWTDLGAPERVIDTRASLGVSPDWTGQSEQSA